MPDDIFVKINGADMVRVLHVFGTLNRGGAESRTMDIYRAIDKENIQFDFVTHGEEDGVYGGEIKTLGGKIYTVPKYKVYNFVQYIKVWKAFCEQHPEYHIIHIHTTNSAAAVLKAVKKHIPIRIVHSRNAGNPSFKKINLMLTRRYINANATERLAVSRKAADYIFGRGRGDRKEVQVVPNAINISAYGYDPGSRKQKRKELQIENAYVIGHVGRFEKQKNHAYLMDIFQSIVGSDRNIRLVLVGDGELKSDIEARAKKNGVYEKCLFLGVREDVPALMQAFDILMLPSRFEGMPGVVLEAQAAGLLCLISEEVTKECSVVEGLCKFLPINKKDIVQWRDAFFRYVRKPRAKDVSQMYEKGFDIKKQVLFYEALYTGEQVRSGVGVGYW